MFRWSGPDTETLSTEGTHRNGPYPAAGPPVIALEVPLGSLVGLLAATLSPSAQPDLSGPRSYLWIVRANGPCVWIRPRRRKQGSNPILSVFRVRIQRRDEIWTSRVAFFPNMKRQEPLVLSSLGISITVVLRYADPSTMGQFCAAKDTKKSLVVC
jgi:hypothetical protein